MEAYMRAMNGYTSFSGRSSRTDYWLFQLFVGLFSVAAIILDKAFGLTGDNGGGGPLYSLVMLFHMVPGISAAVRRLHDTERSGWWFLLGHLPLLAFAAFPLGQNVALAVLLLSLAGPIALFVFLCLGSTPGTNRFGPNPHGE